MHYILRCATFLSARAKDFGSKESFAIVLNRETSKNIVEALIEVFNRRWKQAIEL
jgi:hypothetical protein